MSLTIPEVLDKARAYGFIKPGLVVNFPILTNMVEQADRRREEEDAAWEARAEARAEEAWRTYDARTDLQRQQDDDAAREEAWHLGL